MNPRHHFMALLCVGLSAGGQVLFKLTANSINAAGTLLDRGALLVGLASLVVYGLMTALWVVLLQSAPLGRAYPYMALTFVIVGLVSWLYFQEPISGLHATGLALIVAGIVLVAMG